MDFISGKIKKRIDASTFELSVIYQRVGNKQKYHSIERLRTEEELPAEELMGCLLGVEISHRDKDNCLRGEIRMLQDYKQAV